MIPRTGKTVLMMAIPLLFLALLGLPSMAETTVETPKQVSLSIPNMVCMSCEMQIETAVTAVDGVTDVEFDGEQKLATISFDPTRASLEAILDASEAAGYPATLVGDASG